MEPVNSFTSRVVPLPNENIDTDIIIPARFLKITDKANMEQYCFHDWRFDSAGKPRLDFILNQTRAKGAKILLVGKNFGTGSSREHAPWTLMAFGFRAIISLSFADIFRSNALKNGLLPVELPASTCSELFELAEKNPAMELTVDLASQSVKLPNGRSVEFPIDNFSKKCLLEGVDQLGYILKQEKHIQAFEQAHPVTVPTSQLQ
ncbi:MAG: 3-isopropylmalate dehydratase small subunit [Acidobacteria bacterium RIFCSPLOWO2_12_FULL_54_10]|nr:MAG: 3-isopropylmalate dehydratase small subunit [Acidobacteria bacterium RIFCSPLOWO2_12_FULL_54_10]